MLIGWLAETWGFTDSDNTDTNTSVEYTVHSTSETELRYIEVLTRNLDDIRIEGSDVFVKHVNRCLEEIKNTKWEYLVATLRGIIMGATYADSGVNHLVVYEAGSDSMGRCAWNPDYILGASVLIHEAIHAKRMLRNEFDITNYAGEELLALAAQAEFLRFHRHSSAADIENADGRHNEAYMSAEILALQR